MSKKATADYIDAYLRWQHLNNVGGQDPFCEDGTNMFLCRNHMLNAIKAGAEVPEDMPLPDNVNFDYMADKEGILSRANALLEKILADTDYQQLMSLNIDLMGKELKSDAEFIINRVKNFQYAIQTNDCVSMRRVVRNFQFDRAKTFFEVLGGFQPASEQVSLFDMMQEDTE